MAETGGRFRPVLIAVCALVCGHPAGTSGSDASPTPAFAVQHYVFDRDGQFAGSGKGSYQEISSFFYGQVIADVVLYPEPAAAGTHADPGEVKTQATRRALAPNAPSRPPASRFQVDRWTKEDGLPANKVRSLHQSRDGYLWVGTVEGLARFDGVRFVIFNEENTPEMAKDGSIVRTIYEDEQARLWLGTKRGMLCRIGDQFPGFVGQEQFRGKTINGLAQRSEGGFWAAHDTGLSWRDDSGVHELPVDGVESPFCVVEHGENTLWIGAANGLFRLDLRNRAVVRRLLDRVWRTEPLAGAPVYGLMEDSSERLWIGARSGAMRFDDAGTRLTRRSIGFRNGVWVPSDARFAEDLLGRVWATGQMLEGIALYHREGKPELIETPKIWDAMCVEADREGAVWVGTHEGLVRLREHLFSPMRLGSKDSKKAVVQSMAEASDGSLVFASRTFVGSWSGGSIRVVDFGRLQPRPDFVPAVAVFGDELWMSHPHGGLIKLPEFTSARLTHARMQVVHPEIGNCRTLHVGKSGSLWVAGEEGLFQMTNSAQERLFYTGVKRVAHALLEDSDGGVWIGGEQGLDYWKNGRLAPRRKALAGLNVLSLHQGPDKTLWIGTASGLCGLRNGTLHRFGAESGVPQAAIHALVEDDFGRLWLNHRSGVARVEMADLNEWIVAHRTPAVRRFGIADGLSNRGILPSPQSALKIRDGRLWFAKGTGLAGIDPARCPLRMPAPEVHIERALVNGHSLPLGSHPEVSGEGLRSLEFEFSVPRLHSPEKTLVQYRLEGYEADWHDSGRLRRVVYGKLKAGTYRFAVRARDHEGSWSARDAEVTFEVVPPYWQTGSFRLASGTSVAVLLGGMGVWILGSRRRQATERHAAVTRERERLARNLHDHLAPHLAEIALAPRLEDATRAAERISCDELPGLIWEVHPENDTLPSMLDYLVDFAQRYLHAASIALELDLPFECPNVPLPHPARREISALFKESLHNVARHAGATRVWIAARWTRTQFELRIQDNGRGFDQAQTVVPHRAGLNGGHGLGNFQTRCRALGGRCRIVTAPDQGTAVTFVIPLAAEL